MIDKNYRSERTAATNCGGLGRRRSSGRESAPTGLSSLWPALTNPILTPKTASNDQSYSRLFKPNQDYSSSSEKKKILITMTRTMTQTLHSGCPWTMHRPPSLRLCAVANFSFCFCMESVSICGYRNNPENQASQSEIKPGQTEKCLHRLRPSQPI
jgi:hypothetical protein